MFSLKTYPKSSFALLYSPENTPEAATRTLNRWIKRCTPLSEELKEMNYNPRRHTLMKREVAAIVRHLGEP